MPHVDEGALHAYLDGELPPAERTMLETHLADCASCRAQLAEERALLERATALLGAARPADRAAPPFEQLRPRMSSRSPWRVRMPIAWAASIALALGLGYYLHEPAPQFEPSVESPRPLAVSRAQDQSAPPAEETKQRAATPRRHAGDRSPAGATAPSTPTAPTDIASANAAAEKAAPDRARADSIAPATRRNEPTAGAIAAAPQMQSAQPPAAAPTPSLSAKAKDSLPLLSEVVVTAAPSRELAEMRGRATTTSWPIISRGAARSLLGTDPVGLPGLARQIRRSPAASGTVVVEQLLDSSTMVQFFQHSASAPTLDSSVKLERSRGYMEDRFAATDRLARYVGRLRVEIAGPLSVDSLNRLLDQVQPLP